MTFLTSEQISAAHEQAYKELRAKGYNGGMAGQQWDMASARAVEKAVLEAISRSGAGMVGVGKTAKSEPSLTDTAMLDFLEQSATVNFSFETASIEFAVPDNFEGANTVRKVILAAAALKQMEEVGN